MLKSSFNRNLSTFDAGITRVSKDVLWIGCNDWDLREFHSMQAPVGTSYNSYVIEGTQPAVIDSVKAPFYNQWVSRLQSIYGNDLKGIHYIIMQHAEPDHSSALPIFLQHFPHIKLVTTKQCYDVLSNFYKDHKKWNFIPIKQNEKFQFGNREIIMKGVPMAHWPEQCITYLSNDNVLFSSDSFGQHIATTKRFADEIDNCLYQHEQRSYFANILMKLKNPVLKCLQTARSFGKIDIVLPAHGVGIRTQKEINKSMKNYENWALQKPAKKLTIVYDCNWFGTEKMAVAMASGAGSVGVEVKMFHARKSHITNVATDVVDSAGIAVGSAVLHESILPDLACHLSYLKCLGIRDKVGTIFGTYGWTEGIITSDIRNQLFVPTKIKEISQPIIAHWSPKDDDLFRCEEAGKRLGEACISRYETEN